MELATRIQLPRGAEIFNSSTASRFIDIAELSSRGLPKSNEGKLFCSFDLRAFEIFDFNEYANAYNIASTALASHSTWSVVHQGTRYIIPALAFLRAFFRPHNLLFPRIFEPQSLDDVCSYSEFAGETGIRLSARFSANQRQRFNSAMWAISWFYCFPSARRAWASVFQAANQGCIHFELPLATATFKLTGKNVNGSIFVSDLFLQGIECHERPFNFANRHPTSITRSSGNYGLLKTASEVRYHKMTEAEWIHISAVLDSFDWKTRPGSYDRSVTNAILFRLTSKVAWSTAAQMHDVSVFQAVGAFRRWQTDGRLDRVIERLCELRTDGQDAEKARRRFDSRKTLNLECRALSQTEWETVKSVIGPRTGKGVTSKSYRNVVNSLWVQQSSNNKSPKVLANTTNLSLKTVKSMLGRWRADGRLNRVMEHLLTLERPENEKSKLSDDQWLTLAPLVSPLHEDPYQDDRSMFNCILEKLTSGITWESAAHRNGLSFNRLIKTRVVWQSDGRLERALTQLREMRASKDPFPTQT